MSFLYHNDPEVVRATALVDPQYLYCADAAARSDFIAGVVMQLVQGAFAFSAVMCITHTRWLRVPQWLWKETFTLSTAVTA